MDIRVKATTAAMGVCLLIGVAGCASARLPKEVYIDKCKGAWAGQMIGVCYGAPYEFRSNGAMIEGPLEPWRPERVNGAIGQDDCYVEMTFLMAIEKYGLDVTYEQAGVAFAEAEYGLAHANHHGRENCRHGIMPPLSGNPRYNRHADDIDFQIEADLFGIICPGLPNESNRLGDVFGHIMNYGDGVYGGLFVAGMYAAAYFEDTDARKIVQMGLACIPRESRYHQCISDVLRWHKQHPDDWTATWRLIEEKWQDDLDCEQNWPFNIDARINGAYIVVGLLYGEGDMLKTMDIATRCGQDADCNASSAAGVLGCMKGFAALDGQLTDGIAAIADTKFAHTNYSFNTLITACQAVTERIVCHAGGQVTEDAYIIPTQAGRPAKLEQWEDQQPILTLGLRPHEVKWWDERWDVPVCGQYMGPGFYSDIRGRKDVLVLHAVSKEQPAVLAATLDVPAGSPKLVIDIASHEEGDVVLKVVLDGTVAMEQVIDTKGQWTTVSADLAAFAGKSVPVRVEIWCNEWHAEVAYIDFVEIR